MKQKLLNVSLAALIGLSSVSAHAQLQAISTFLRSLVPSGDVAKNHVGFGVLNHTAHVFPICVAGKYCFEPDTLHPFNPPWTTVWFDLVLNGITAIDAAASFFQGDRTVKAQKAIEKLEKALKEGDGCNGSGGGDTSGSAAMATIYTDDHIMYTIEMNENKTPQALFDATRKAIKQYVFETPAPDIKGDCTQSDKDCAIARQNEWLLASVTLASATADKVLDQTAKKNVQDVKTNTEKSADDTTNKSKDDTTKEKTATGGETTLTDHFSELAEKFNAAKSPMDLYNAMANIVLDTHRQANDANALMGRDLEAQGLRLINKTGAVSLTEATEEE